MVYDRACRCEVWDRPQTFLSLRGGHKVVSRNRFQLRFSGAAHVHGSPVPGERMIMDVLQGSLPGQGSRARRGAHVRGGRVQGSVPGVHQFVVELMFVAGFVAGSSSRLAPEVAVSSRPARVTFSESLSRGTTTFPQARQCRTRSGWVLTESWKLTTSRCD